MAKVIYAIVLIPFILMLVDMIKDFDITHQNDSLTNTGAYADDFTTAGKTTEPKK